VTAPESGRTDEWRCPHAPECEERFDTLAALNEHVDNTTHGCCQRAPEKADQEDDRG
jgi:hypothetical protein